MKGPRIIQKKAIDTAHDPYLMGLPPEELAVCKVCGVVWHSKHWSLPNETLTTASNDKAVQTTCPACRKTADRFPQGFVTIKGAFTVEHKDEILNLLRNKEARALHINPLERIMEIKERGGAIEVSTTTDKLAQRIGRMLHKAYGGEIEYKWGSDDKLARVYWTRNDSAEKVH